MARACGIFVVKRMTQRKIILLSIVALCFVPQSGYGWKMFSADAPDTGLLGNSFIDILYHEGTIWLATGSGLSYSTDDGVTWYTRTVQTNPELGSDEPSALWGRPGEVWVACSHFQMYQGINYPIGDGISRSTDNGETWVNFSPPEAANYAQLVYDLSGTGSAVYAACFHGGMIVRHDPDTAWKHLFYSPADSTDWSADDWADLPSGRYYSCIVDTTHADTLIVYGGSARGINKFIYLPKRVKLGGQGIYDIVQVGALIYLAHERGVSQVDTATVSRFYTADITNGLGGEWIRKLTLLGGKLWAGAFDPVDSSGRGLFYLDNPDSAWTAIGDNLSGPPDLWAQEAPGLFEGPGTGVFDFGRYEDSLISTFYIAAGDSGVFRSIDTGRTWTRFFADSSDMDMTSPRNQVYSIDVTGDSLFLGTRAGLVTASYVSPFSIDFRTLLTFPEHDSSGSMVSLVRHQDNDSASFTWVALAPQTDSGNYSAVFLDPESPGVLRQTTILWSPEQTRTNGFWVSENLTTIATSTGLFTSLNYPSPLGVGKYNVVDVVSGRTLENAEFLSTTRVGEHLFTGSTGGFGKYLGENQWQIFLANTDPSRHDLAVAIRHDNVRLPGDWVVGLDIQPYDTGAVLWAACRGVTDTLSWSDDSLRQRNAVGFSTDYGNTWTKVLLDTRVWNFAFDSQGTAYAAASEGLFAADPPWNVWRRLPIVDPRTQDTIVTASQVFSVAVAEDVLWVGTGLGLAYRHLDADSSWNITRIFTPTATADEVYAAPVPYSPVDNNGRLSIHYRVENSADVTVEVYDFAMNLVRVLADDKPRAGGADYFETWDGYNGRGDMVAVGMYYFKVSYSTGEQRWGRLAIIP